MPARGALLNRVASKDLAEEVRLSKDLKNRLSMRPVLSSRNTLQTTHKIPNFLVATLKSKKRSR